MPARFRVFNIPVDNLYALPVLLEYITKRQIQDLVVVSPDAGGVERARPLPNGFRPISPSSTSGARDRTRPKS